MPAHIIRGRDFTAIACTREPRRRRLPRCKYCTELAPFSCDFPMSALGVIYPDGQPRTCDAPICEAHRVHVGENLDYCIVHHQNAIVPNERPVFGAKG